MQDKKGFLALLTDGLILGTYGIWIRYFQHTFTTYEQVIWRSIIAFFLAIFIALLLRTTWGFEKKHGKHLTLYLFCFAISTILFTLGVVQTSIAISVFGLYAGSILSAFILGVVFFQEKITVGKSLSTVLVIVALILLTLPFSTKSFGAGLLISIASGIFDGIGNAFKKYFGGKIEIPALIVYQTCSTLLVAFFLTLFVREPFSFSQLSFITTGMMVLYGAIFLAVAYLSMYGFQHFDLNLGTIIISSELFWAPIFALLFLHETITSQQVVGGLLIAGAIIVPYIRIREFSKLNFK